MSRRPNVRVDTTARRCVAAAALAVAALSIAVMWPAHAAPATAAPATDAATTTTATTPATTPAPAAATAAAPRWTVSSADPPRRLSETGLYVAGSTSVVAPGNLAFTPQYALWTDGADKQRWLRLPPGTAIDATRPDAWQFPVGTRLWKAFSYGGRPAETRLIERRNDGSWLFATYVWRADGSDADLAPERGLPTFPAPAAPGGRHAVPGRHDCLSCHEGAAGPVLGVGALQLSPDRDPLAPGRRPRAGGDADLRTLIETGRLRGLPRALVDRPPRIAAASPTERAALGYLHANCGHCHNRGGVPVALTLAQSVGDPERSRRDAVASAVLAASRYLPPGFANGAEGAAVVIPGRSTDSVLHVRMASRHPQVQMPPLGTLVPDPEGLALVTEWIDHDLPRQKELRR